MRFLIHESRDRGVVVLGPDGDLNEAASGVLEAKVLEIMERGEQRIVIDLGSTSGTSSHALRMLLMLSKKLQSVGGRLVVCNARSGVQNALNLSGLTRLCCVKPDRDQAVRALMVEEGIVRLADLIADLLGRAERRRAASEPV